ncbi:MAG: hypothetical protein KatS3mg111_2665 [Pirellulaceae bacterium]|nr:MAG: hypothetical protein KatS3mg111_2665 [Pirellulaceae bacterium]
MNVDATIRELLSFDSEPPNEDYSPLEHGEQLGSGLSPGVARELVIACWQSLPATLAETFLEGLLEKASINEPVATMLQCLENAREVSSASSIVRILRRKYNVSSEKIVEYAVTRLGSATDKAVQDRLAYAILSAGLTTLDQAREILALQRTGLLSGYARECLEEAVSARFPDVGGGIGD